MRHNDDSYATMLLMSQITPNREELVKPLSVSEWHALKTRARDAGTTLGALVGLDMSGFMMELGLTEQEAYRLCVLLGRSLPLSMSMERFAGDGLDIVTYDERAYPDRLRDRLGDKAPPMLYLAGRPELFKQDAIAILGALPARGDAEARVRALARMAVECGYLVLSDGAIGVSRIAEDEAMKAGGKVLEITADALSVRAKQPDMGAMLEKRCGAAMSVTHPDAPGTMIHALSRNKCVYALAQATFVFAAQEKKGVTWDGAVEALNRGWADFIYAWDTPIYSGNRPLIARGARAFGDVTRPMFEQMIQTWRGAMAEQLCMFDRNDMV